MAKAALAVDEVIEKAALSATGKALRHHERKAKKKQEREARSGSKKQGSETD